MIKQILVIKDPEMEVDFKTVTKYAEVVQKRLGDDIQVLPIWPHGEIELIGDKRRMKLRIRELKKIIEELEVRLSDSSN